MSSDTIKIGLGVIRGFPAGALALLERGGPAELKDVWSIQSEFGLKIEARLDRKASGEGKK